MKTFGIKLLNAVLIVTVILGCNVVLHNREQNEKITQLQFELENNQQNKNQIQEQQKDENIKYIDGIYEGEADGYGGTVIVQVSIENDTLKELNIISAEKEDKAYFDAAIAVIDSILEKQSTDVDTVSGATFSSNGIIHATENALRKAEKIK
ncbi:MAG: FMN-binding protein [Ruminococcus sp.]|nr:FMN-binding protein [Ruminococcus sp.]